MIMLPVNKLLKKEFIFFIIIGLLNTLIDFLVYYFLSKKIFMSIFFSKSIAFLLASIFSYFSNAKLTFNVVKKTLKQFVAVIFLFIIKWLLSVMLTYMFDFIIINIGLESFSSLATIFSTIVLVPITYLVLEKVFKTII